MEREKLLFLDIDGVLNDHKAWPNGTGRICYERVRHLNTILDRVPEVKIVLSSAWRYAFQTPDTIEPLLLCHGANCKGRVHGATCADEEVQSGPMPGFDDAETWQRLGLSWRTEQIQLYVSEHKSTNYLVLDDLPLDLPHTKFLRTDPSKGLTEFMAEIAVILLNQGESDG